MFRMKKIMVVLPLVAVCLTVAGFAFLQNDGDIKESIQNRFVIRSNLRITEELHSCYRTQIEIGFVAGSFDYLAA